MIREVAIRTPENIVFTYRLAGLGSRALAALVDTVILGLMVGLIAGIASLLGALGALFGGRFVAAAATGIALALVFAFVFGYYAVFEALWNGQTPGKRLMKIRVVKDRGHGIRLVDALLRNFLRIADILPGLYLVAGLTAVLSSTNKRLGDYAAGTLVVNVEPTGVPARDPLPPVRFNSLREDPVLAARVRNNISTEETELAREILTRDTTAASRRAAAATLAATLRNRLNLGDWTFLSDDALLRDIIEVLEHGDDVVRTT